MAAHIFRCSLGKSKLIVPFVKAQCIRQERSFKRWHVYTMILMKKRRKEAGPPPDIPRSMWWTWDRRGEIYAFGKRLNEDFKEETLETAFTHKSYIEKEEEKRKELAVPPQDTALKMEDNSSLIAEGTDIMNTYIVAYLRHSFPLLPEEGVCALHDFLTSEEVLSHVSFHIGTEELILCGEEKPTKATLALTLKAIIGAINRDQNLNKAEIFVQDFILTQLVGKDITDLWEIPNPMAILTSILERENRDPPEPRLLWKAGTNTILAIYHVGIYSNKVLLGEGPGETVSMAVEIAARDALNKMFCVTTDLVCLEFGDHGHILKLDEEKVNVPLSEWSSVTSKLHKYKINA